MERSKEWIASLHNLTLWCTPPRQLTSFFWPASSQLTVVFPFSHITAGWRADLENEKSGFLFLKRRILSCKRNGLILLTWWMWSALYRCIRGFWKVQKVAFHRGKAWYVLRPSWNSIRSTFSRAETVSGRLQITCNNSLSLSAQKPAYEPYWGS